MWGMQRKKYILQTCGAEFEHQGSKIIQWIKDNMWGLHKGETGKMIKLRFEPMTPENGCFSWS